MLKCVVIDDDEMFRKAIKQSIERTDGLELIREFESADEAIKNIENVQCDLIFLDIEMPGMNGMEFISLAVNIPQVILVSASPDYAAEAFNYDVTDYLVKPFNYKRFLQSIDRAKQIDDGVTKNNPDKDHLFFKKNNALIRVNFNDINYIEAYADYVTVYACNQKFVVLSTMKAVEQRFPSEEFKRVHRSYIVRLDKITSIQDNAVQIADKVIPVSRSYKSDFLIKMNIF